MWLGLLSNAEINIASWNIKVNNQDIIENSDITSAIELIVPETDYNLEDYIVPGAIGYFDIVVDGSSISVPFKYTVTSILGNNNEISDLKIIGYSIDNNNDSITYLTDLNPNVEINVQPNTNSTVRVFVQWNDDTNTENLNDTEDTFLAQDEAIGSIIVTVKFEQRH